MPQMAPGSAVLDRLNQGRHLDPEGVRDGQRHALWRAGRTTGCVTPASTRRNSITTSPPACATTGRDSTMPVCSAEGRRTRRLEAARRPLKPGVASYLSVAGTRAGKSALNPRSFSTSMSGSASRIARLRMSSQRRRSARWSASAGSGCSAEPDCHRPPGVVETRPAGRQRPHRGNRSRASDSRACSGSAAAAGSAENPVRAQNASRTCSHCGLGRKNSLNRPKFLRAIDGEVAGLDLVADPQEQGAVPASAIGYVADEQGVGRDAAASRAAVFTV